MSRYGKHHSKSYLLSSFPPTIYSNRHFPPKEVKSSSCCLWSNHLPLKFADYFDFVFIELTSLLASRIVREEHLTLSKFSLNMVTLKAIHSSLRRNFQRLILLSAGLINQANPRQKHSLPLLVHTWKGPGLPTLPCLRRRSPGPQQPAVAGTRWWGRVRTVGSGQEKATVCYHVEQ